MDIYQPAYILHSRAYRETSLIATFLTPDYGKVNGVIRGARSTRQRGRHKQAVLQPFQKVQIQWRESPPGASDLLTIRSYEADNLRFPLEAEAAFCGLYLNELLYRLLYGGVGVDALFSQYERALLGLLKTTHRNEQAWVLRQFELQLLEALGVSVHCITDAQQQPIVPEREYDFYAEMGAFVALASAPEPGGVRLSGRCLLKLASREYCEACLPVWKQLMRQVLSLYLGNKPILARALFKVLS
jgi:DNA repair protein RecO (recombination protein O)